MSVQSIQRCRDLTDDHINAAIETRGDTRELLEHAVAIARPREAGARVLLVFARMASPACDWLEGALRVELARSGSTTVIESFAVIGAGLKERVFPRMVLNVPFDEFILAIKKFPQAIQPLSIDTEDDEALTLVAVEAAKLAEADQRIPTPGALSAADLPTVDAGKAPPKPLAKLKLERRAPALGHTISEEIVTQPKGDSRRDSTGEHPAMPVIQLPDAEESKEPAEETDDDVDTNW